MTPARLDATFAALADPTRRAILARLASGEASVAELAKPFAMSQPAISKHLKVLERAGLISHTASAQRRPRRLEAEPLAEATQWLERYREFWEATFLRLDDLLEELKAKEREEENPSHETKEEIVDANVARVQCATNSSSTPMEASHEQHRNAQGHAAIRSRGEAHPRLQCAALDGLRCADEARAAQAVVRPARILAARVRGRPQGRRALALRAQGPGWQHDGNERQVSRASRRRTAPCTPRHSTIFPARRG